MLSTPTAADIDAIAQCCQDAAVQRWTTVPSPYSHADAEHFVHHIVDPGWEAGTAATWGIRAHERAPVVGMIGLSGIAHGGAELGFWLGSAARGAGVMSEAVRLVCDFGFAQADSGVDSGVDSGLGARVGAGVDAGLDAGLGLQRIQWHAIIGNAASASVAWRAGFRFEGTKRLGGVQRGIRVDAWSAALLSTDERRPAGGWPPETLVATS